MSILGFKRIVILLGSVCVGLLVLCCSLFWSYGSFKIQVAFASEQTKVFHEMREQALQSDVMGAAGYLEYILGYYPSGTKQQTGSDLDLIVERERALAIKEIIAFLRSKTDEDLGKNPAVWIQKYTNNK